MSHPPETPSGRNGSPKDVTSNVCRAARERETKSMATFARVLQVIIPRDRGRFQERHYCRGRATLEEMDVALGEIKTAPRAGLRLAYCALGKKVSRGTLLKVLGWDAFGTPISAWSPLPLRHSREFASSQFKEFSGKMAEGHSGAISLPSSVPANKTHRNNKHGKWLVAVASRKVSRERNEMRHRILSSAHQRWELRRFVCEAEPNGAGIIRADCFVCTLECERRAGPLVLSDK
uniref:Uncharacterized protein n=1 Tax=Anopheles merus TaxID=30066 RepID=A0A182VGX8_ANOME